MAKLLLVGGANLRKIDFNSFSYVDELLYWSGRRMILDEYLQGDLTPSRLPSTWVSGSHFVFQSDEGGLAVLDTANDSISTLVTNHTLVSCELLATEQHLTALDGNLKTDSDVHNNFPLLSLLQRQLNVKGYQCSLDLRYVLFKHNVKQVSGLLFHYLPLFLCGCLLS